MHRLGLSLALMGALVTGCEGERPGSGPAATLAQPRAVLTMVKGSVKVKRAAGDDWIEAAEKMQLFENDKVRTAAGAQADVVFPNGSALLVGPEALIGIAETHVRPGQERTDVTVLKGRIDAELDQTSQSLSVATPTASVRAGREIVFQ